MHDEQRQNDADAVRRALAGDREGFGVLVDRYAAGLTAFAYDRLGELHEAQDAVQETFVRALERLPDLREQERFAAWAYEILRNLCAMRLRRRGVEERSQLHLAAMRAGRGELTAIGRLEQEERSRRLRLAVTRLPPLLREAVVARYLGGAGRREAASLLGITPQALDKRIQRALAQLREAMAGGEE